MAKHHEPSAAEGTAVLAAIQEAEREANQLLERARASHDQLLAKARAAAAQWEQKELSAARAEAAHALEAAKPSKPGSAKSKEAEALRAQGEKNLPKAVALISDSFDRFLDELTAEPAPLTGAKAKAKR